MRASFLDPQGPFLARVMPYFATAFVPLVFGARFVVRDTWEFGEVATAAFATCVAWSVIRLLRPRQSKAMPVELELGPGRVQVKRAGTRAQAIVAKSIRGATTSTTSKGVLLTLDHADRTHPISIEVETEAEADRVRRALGIGHGGFGVVGWSTRSDSGQRVGLVGTIGLLVLSVGMLLANLAHGLEATLIGAGIASMAAPYLLPLLIVGLFAKSRTPSVQLDATGLGLATTKGWKRVPYASVQDVRFANRHLYFDMHGDAETMVVPSSHRALDAGLGRAEFRHLRAQVLAAASRGRGLGRPKEDVASRLDVLRRNQEAPRDWLARLDTMGELLANSTGYRGVTVDPEDLFRALEDPEADGELRTAALRVVRHLDVPDGALRIEEAVAAVHDARESRKLRIATTEDVDAAGRELAQLDEEEARLAAYPRWR